MFITIKSVVWRLGLATAGLLVAANIEAAPEIEHWETANGARVFYVHTPELPMVDVRVIFDAGSARDGDQGGVAALTNGLLTTGAGKRDEESIAATIDQLGANLEFDSLRDMALVSLRSLTEERLLQPALEVMADVIQRPLFPQNALERERARQLVAIEAQKQQPGTLAEQAFFRALYGNHPYAEPSSGTAETVSAIQRNHLQMFHARYYVGMNAVVAIVGAVDRERAAAIAEEVVGRLPAGEAAPELPLPVTARPGERITIDYPSVQSHLLLGHPVLQRGDPDYFSLYVGNHILGGSGLVSMISEQVREERGLAYSAYSYFAPMRAAGPFQAGLQTKNESREEALEVLRQTIERFIEEGPDPALLARTKKNITGGFPLRVDSNKKIVDYLGVIGFYRLPIDYLERFNRYVEGTTEESIRDAFKRRLRPQEMVTVVVGGELSAKP